MHPSFDFGFLDFLTPYVKDQLRSEGFLKFSLLAFSHDGHHLLGLHVFVEVPFSNS
jgi:hypothetical protein